MAGRWRAGAAWQVGFPAAVGAVAGWLGTLFWLRTDQRYRACTATGGLDCLGAAPVYFVVGLPVALLAIWAVLAWARVWLSPVVAIGGMAATAYAVRLYEAVVNPDRPPPLWLGVPLAAAAFAAVATACLRGLHWVWRVLVVVLLVAVYPASSAVEAWVR